MRAELGRARDRRSGPRYDVLERQLIYVDLRCDSGGIVLNCGEGGIAIQAVAPPPQRPGHELLVFLPDGPQPVVATGDIVWVNDSHQVGIRFTAMPDIARTRLAEWFEQTAQTHLAAADDPEPWEDAFTALHEKPQGVVVRCRNCGHPNPEESRFCGMCGNSLAPQQAAEPEYVVENVPSSVEWEASEAPRQTAVEPEQVETRAEPAPLEPVALASPRDDKWSVYESSTTVGGPSFLGMSSADSSEGGGYSYLFQEEERSHKGLLVFLIVLLAVGGVLYAKWQPIFNYVLTTALTHSHPRQPAPRTRPLIKAPPLLARRRQPRWRTGSRQQTAKSQPSEKHRRMTQMKQARARRTKIGTAKKAAATQAYPGSELVTSGEKYLYGRGAPRSCNQAVIYFNAAAAKQNPQAFSHLGALHATGECVPMDRVVAYAWFRRAYTKEPNNHYFEQNLTMLWRDMTPEERQRATGRQ
jgi:hypothetical protein